MSQRRAPALSAAWFTFCACDLGDKDHAFEWLNTAYNERDPNMLGLKTNGSLDSLRSKLSLLWKHADCDEK
jgi:hypothetical protein